MANLTEIREFLDAELKLSEIPDYPGAVNGLQLENPGPVDKVVAAVDASGPVIDRAVAAGAGLLIVHHGLFWQGARPITGPMYRKIRRALEAGMAIYSAHLPLDVHPRLGNNIGLANALGVEPDGAFLEWKGIRLGLCADVDRDRDEFLARATDVLGSGVHHCPGGPARIRRLGIVTGGAGSEVGDAAAAGIDTFLTGEGPHWSYPLAEELGVNLIYGGHYATETFGVRALADELAARFGVEREFIDHPTGL
jgi:dinuclear metal center YbgI/SA1388 family protein